LVLTPEEKQKRRQRRDKMRLTIVAVIILWTYFYNLLVKGFSPVHSFFQILDTISDDFVVGTLLTVGLGLGIVLVFSVTKLYTQVVANIFSFRIIEQLVSEDLRAGRFREFFGKLVRIDEQPNPSSCCPTNVASLLLSLSFLYVVSWVYVVLFSEALYFVCWSAGVKLPINEENVVLLPTLALAIPFSARVMAYVRYPYAQDYADFMPGAVFVLLLVAASGAAFGSRDQEFFLEQVYGDRTFLNSFRRNGAFLAFIPVFFEGVFWLIEVAREESQEDSEQSVAAQEPSEESPPETPSEQAL